MAIIGTIRNRMGVLLVIFVGLALALFILEGLFSSSNSIFSSGNDVAKVGKERVSVQEFEQRVQKIADEYKAQMNTESLDNAMMDQVREQAWGQMINEMIFGREYESLGLSVSPAELFDMVQGKNIDPQIRRAFTDPKTGQFSPANVVQFLKNLDNVEDATRQQWFALESGIRDRRLKEKYGMLISQSVYVTSAQAREDFISRNRYAKIRYVLQNYNTIPDNTVKVGDDDQKDYYNSHKEQFKQENSRRLEYVSFDIVPSAEDKKQTEEEVNKLFAEFKTATNDSSFVVQNSDTKTEPRYYKRSQMPAGFDSTLFEASPGHMVEPFLDGDRYKMAKVIGFSIRPDSVKARHILLRLASAAEKVKVKERADSIKKAIKEGASFEELAKKYSSDPGSAQKGGDLGTFAEGSMVKAFNDACFEGKAGEMPIVETQYGIHIIQIEDQIKPSRRIKLAIVDRKLEPSSKTYQSLYAVASDFASRLTAGDDMAQIATKKGVSKRDIDVRESDHNFAGYEGSREIIRWAFKAKENETSKVFETTDHFVIAKLTQIREKGYATIEQVHDQLVFLVKKDKKAQMLADKVDHQITGAVSIDAVATKTGTTVQNAENINFANASITGVGREPVVAGTLFALKQGQLSQAIKGTAGVFVLVVDNFTEATLPKDFNMYKTMLAANLRQRAAYEAMNALRTKADIQDYRIRFY